MSKVYKLSSISLNSLCKQISIKETFQDRITKRNEYISDSKDIVLLVAKKLNEKSKCYIIKIIYFNSYLNKISH